MTRATLETMDVENLKQRLKVLETIQKSIKEEIRDTRNRIAQAEMSALSKTVMELLDELHADLNECMERMNDVNKQEVTIRRVLLIKII